MRGNSKIKRKGRVRTSRARVENGVKNSKIVIITVRNKVRGNSSGRGGTKKSVTKVKITQNDDREVSSKCFRNRVKVNRKRRTVSLGFKVKRGNKSRKFGFRKLNFYPCRGGALKIRAMFARHRITYQ